MRERRAASEGRAGRHANIDPHALRIQVLQRRRGLSADAVSTASLRIVARVAQDSRVRRAARSGPVGLYWPVGGEPDVRPPPRADPPVIGAPVAVHAPHGVTLPGHPDANPRLVRWDLDATLATAWGALRYPTDGAAEVAPGDHGVILVPGVAFDPAGNRLGNGGGWYDRLLAGLGGPRADSSGGATPLLIGVAHEFQLVEHVDAQHWDVPMHLIVTPSQLVSARSSGS